MVDTALITGGAGFVGAHLARELLERGWRVVLVDDFSRGRADEQLDALLEGGAELIEHDLTRPLDGRLAAVRPQLVFHLAAVVGVRNVTERPERVIRENLLTLQNVLDWSVPASPRAFLFSSSSEVADGALATGLAAAPVTEEVPFVCLDLHAPRATYAMSKAYGEMLVANTGRRHGLAVRSVRFFNVYGPRMGHSHVIPELIGRVLSPTPTVDVHGTEPTRAFCYVSDAVRALLAVAELPGREPLVVNVGNDREETSIESLAHRILTIAGSRAKLNPLPAPPGSPPRRCPDITRLRRLTGFEPAVPLEQGLRRTLASYARASVVV